MNITCPCRRTVSIKSLSDSHSLLKYQNCCKPLHTQQVKANSAEQLMRSRYSAYVLKLADYLLMTQHPDFRQAELNDNEEKLSLEKSFENTEWLGLIIHRKNKTVATKVETSKQSQVQFSAFFRERNSESKAIFQVHELSSFIFENEKWYYTEGKFLEDYKLSKNEKCFCGSGKKFKRCHGA